MSKLRNVLGLVGGAILVLSSDPFFFTFIVPGVLLALASTGP